MNDRKPSTKDEHLTREDIISALFKLEQKNISMPLMDYQYQPQPQPQPVKSSFKPTKQREFLPEDARPSNFGSLDEPDLISFIKTAAKDLIDLVDKNSSPRASNRYRTNTYGSETPYTRDTYDGREDMTERIQQTLERFNESEQKRKERITAMQQEKHQKELSSLQKVPTISHTSKKIVENMNRQPIHQRLEEIAMKKEEALSRMRKIAEEEKRKAESEATFKPDTSASSSYNPKDYKNRSPKQLTEDLYLWYSQKKAVHESAPLIYLDKEVENSKFQPQICKKSKQMTLKNMSPCEAVEERLLRYGEHRENKIQAKIEDTTPSFKPALNRKTQKITDRIKQKIETGFGTEVDFFSSSYSEARPKTTQSQRSLSPGKTLQKFETNRSSPRMNTKTQSVSNMTNVTEIMYTPEVDFLIQRVPM